MNKLPERLSYALKERNKSQKDIAMILECDKSSITNYIKGKYIPKPDAVKRIADYLNVNMMWLYGFSDVMHTDPDFDEFVNEIYKLKLTLSELDEVLCYAQDIKTKRKKIVYFKYLVITILLNLFLLLSILHL